MQRNDREQLLKMQSCQSCKNL